MPRSSHFAEGLFRGCAVNETVPPRSSRNRASTFLRGTASPGFWCIDGMTLALADLHSGSPHLMSAYKRFNLAVLFFFLRA